MLGTVASDGTVVSTRKYDVYGAVRASTGPSGTRHKFVGGLGHPSDDETGLIYMRARYYDPATGRFANQDPSRAGLNWFAYALSCPTVLMDVDGRSPRQVTSWDRFWAGVKVAFQIWLAPFGLAVDDLRQKIEQGESEQEIVQPLNPPSSGEGDDGGEEAVKMIGLFTVEAAIAIFAILGATARGAGAVATRDTFAFA